MNKKSQKMKILDFIEEHGQITVTDAERFDCHRLAARIKDLRDDGYKIVTTYEKNENGGRHGVYMFSALEGEKTC